MAPLKNCGDRKRKVTRRRMALLKPAEKRKWDNRGSRKIAPHTDEGDKKGRCRGGISPAGSDLCSIWASSTSSGEGAWIVSGRRDTGGASGHRRTTRRSPMRHSKFRRVTPIDSDGFEEARERSAQVVPVVSLPERLDGQPADRRTHFIETEQASLTERARNAYVAGQLKELVQIFTSASSHRRPAPPVFQPSPRLKLRIATTTTPSPPAPSPVDDAGSIPKSTSEVHSGTLSRASSIGEGSSDATRTRGRESADMLPSQRTIDKFVVSQLKQLSQLLDMPQAVPGEVAGVHGGGSNADGGGEGDCGSPHASSDWCYSQSTSCSESSPTFSRFSPGNIIAPPPPPPPPPPPRPPPPSVARSASRISSSSSGTGVVTAGVVSPSPSAPFDGVSLARKEITKSPTSRGSFGVGAEAMFSPVNVGSDDEPGGSGGERNFLPPVAVVEYDVESDGEVKRCEAMAVEGDMAAPRSVRFSEVVGRARLWRQMLDMESRATSMLQNIVTENARALDEGLVLPCAPSDEEKVMYHKSGRGFLVTMGITSLAGVSAGMWLFTIAAPYFFWFGVPMVFLLGYLLLSYLGVAFWGEDFDPEDHAAKIRKADEAGFFPAVDIFLPVCNEPTNLLDNTWKYVAALDYPRVAVHVLDDGAKEEVRQLARLHGFNYMRRDNRSELRKAGNLRWAFARTSGELLVIFDADFCPRPEFLRETTPYFANPEIAIVQTPQFFRYREEQTWVEKGAGVTQELFYRMVQVNRNRCDAAICVGACGVYRREAVAPFGGTAAISYSEDVHTGLKCTQLGYKVRYLPQVMAMGTCPDDPRTFFMQQYRWCTGSMTLLTKGEVWGSGLTGMQKLCYISGMFYYSATAMAIFMVPMPGILLIWFKPDAVLWFIISFAVPAIFFTLVAVPCWAKQPYDLCCHRVKVIQSFAHLYAIKDCLMNTSIPWVPTGGGAISRSSSRVYDSSLKLMLCWTTVCTVLVLVGTAWRVNDFPWYHFVPSVVLAIASFALHVSTLL